MSRVKGIHDIADNGVLTVRIRKTVTGANGPVDMGQDHFALVQPGDDQAAIKSWISHDLTGRLKCDAIDASWDSVVAATVAAVHTAEVVAAYNASYKAITGRDRVPMTADIAARMIGGG